MSLSAKDGTHMGTIAEHPGGGWGRWAGAAFAVTLFSIAIKQFGTQAIAGAEISSSSDPIALVAHFAHPGLRFVLWQAGVGLVAALAFFIFFRTFVRARSSSEAVAVILDLIVVVGAVEMGLLFVESALQLGLVDLASAEPSAGASILGLFKTWDWLYNSLIFWLEGSLVALISWVILRSNVVPSWIGRLGILAAIGLYLNTLQVLGGLPSAAAVPAISAFVIWGVSLAVALLRTGREPKPGQV